MHMTLIFSLRIQDVLGDEVSMNILMAYYDEIDYLNKWILRIFLKIIYQLQLIKEIEFLGSL